MRLVANFLLVFLVLVLAPYTPAVEASVSQDSETVNPYVDRTLRYDDELLVSVDIPTALPPKFLDNSRNMVSFNHDQLGDIYAKGSKLFDRNGDWVEINGSDNYNLININHKFALFGDGTYFSFQDEETHSLIEPVPSDSELRDSCSKMGFLRRMLFTDLFSFKLRNEELYFC